MAFGRETDDIIIDKVAYKVESGFVIQLWPENHLQIPLAEVENVKDMQSFENNDVQKVAEFGFQGVFVC